MTYDKKIAFYLLAEKNDCGIHIHFIAIAIAIVIRIKRRQNTRIAIEQQQQQQHDTVLFMVAMSQILCTDDASRSRRRYGHQAP